ncbi:MAG: hypothetical protein LC734_00600 [Acidobacteria bacterium]|nr:hypothetical protein [Acidobacteriota bacterium]
MEPNKKVDEETEDLFERYSDEITRAYERAVREALRKHKLAGNPVAISRNGKVVLLQPDEIEVD